MKKTYITPDVCVDEINATSIIATSGDIKVGANTSSMGGPVTADSKLFDEDFEDEEEW